MICPTLRSTLMETYTFVYHIGFRYARLQDTTFDTSSALSRLLIEAVSCTIGCRGFLTSKLSSQRRLK